MNHDNATRKDFLKAAGAVSLGGAFLAACGSSSSDISSSAPATSAAAADTTAAASTDTNKVGLLNALSGVLSIT